MGLPWPTHRYLLEPLSGEKHVWVRLIGRFILKIEKIEKKMILMVIVYGERWCSINERERTKQWSWIILEMPEHCLFNLFRLRCLWTEVSIWASMISLTNFILHLCFAGMLWYCINSTSSQTRTSNFALFVIIFLRFHPVIDLIVSPGFDPFDETQQLLDQEFLTCSSSVSGSTMYLCELKGIPGLS